MERGETKAIDSRRIKWLQSNLAAIKMLSDATEVEEVVSHPLLDLLQNPIGYEDDSAGFSEYNLFEITQAFLEVVGRCYWYKARGGLNGKQPKELWILAPQLVTELPSTDGKHIIDSYWFTSPFGRQQYDPVDICPFRMPDLYTAGYLGGMSPLRAVIEQVRLRRQVDANSLAILMNRGRPDAMFIPKGDSEGGGIGQDEVARAVSAWRMAFARAGQGGIAFGEYPGSLEMLQWPTKDLIDMTQYQITKSDICSSFDVPSTVLDRKESNLASAETGDWAHANYAGIPRLRRNEATINRFLVSEYDDAPVGERQLFVAYDKPLGLENPAAEFEKARSSATLGSISRNELRRLADLPPLEGTTGDVFYIADNMVPIDPKTGYPMPSAKPTNPLEAKRISRERYANMLKANGLGDEEVSRLVNA